jgi:hypothetical protein
MTNLKTTEVCWSLESYRAIPIEPTEERDPKAIVLIKRK